MTMTNAQRQAKWRRRRKLLERAINMAEMHGTVFIRVTNLPERGEVAFSVILPEYVKVSYDQG